MKRSGNALLVILGLVAVVALMAGGCIMNGINSEVRYRNAVAAKSTANEASLDTMWKIIKQKANITQEATKSVKDLTAVYSDIVNGRTGGALFKMVQESYPNAGIAEVTALYQDVMRTVEAERKTFKTDQLVLQDLLREHRNAQTTFPNSLILSTFGGADSLREFKKKGDAATPDDYPLGWQYTWVTSDATKGMISTGAENDLQIFEKPAPSPTKAPKSAYAAPEPSATAKP